jgi:hypothetical protein
MEDILDYPVVGVTFENRQDILERFYGRYMCGHIYGVHLLKEDDNQYDKNAISVELETNPGIYEKIGYISKDSNVQMRTDWGKLKRASLKSIGYNSKGQLGLAISVVYDKEQCNGQED